jgi:nicotinamidase-related amidase
MLLTWHNLQYYQTSCAAGAIEASSPATGSPHSRVNKAAVTSRHMTERNEMPNEALIVVDMQNDFCDGGALAVPGANAILPLVNRLIGRHDHVILTQDWHPPGHASFASAWSGGEAFSTVQFPYGPQILWPDHCVQGTPGAAFHPDLDADKAQVIIRKGFHPGIDSYSAFRENDRMTRTGLDGYLKARSCQSGAVRAGARLLVALVGDRRRQAGSTRPH